MFERSWKNGRRRECPGLVATIRSTPDWALREASCSFTTGDRQTRTEIAEQLIDSPVRYVATDEDLPGIFFEVSNSDSESAGLALEGVSNSLSYNGETGSEPFGFG
jgi:hypothetical protein